MRISDWSSDVCSSDLAVRLCGGNLLATFPGHVAGALAYCVSQLDRDLDRRVGARRLQRECQRDRKRAVQGKSVSVRVDIGGRCIMKKKHSNNTKTITLKPLKPTYFTTNIKSSQ